MKTDRWYCDVCGKEAVHGEISGGDRDLCYGCYEVKGLKKLSRVELEYYIKHNVEQV
jgi:hypothetical protein